MYKYIKSIYHIFKNYRLYSVPILLSEAIFYFKYNGAFNKFKYLNSNFLSDSIPCPYFFLIKIKKFISKKKINFICDLGSGYGKVLYFFGKLSNYKIDGIEFEKDIYSETKILENNNIKVFNDNILNYNLKNAQYDLFIINDPLKKSEDLLSLINKIKNLNKKTHIVFINMDEKKVSYIENNLIIIESFIISKNKNIFFCLVD